MQPPMPATLARERETIPAFLGRARIGIEAFVDFDPSLVEEHRPEDVGIES